jgi:hypothetical protein
MPQSRSVSGESGADTGPDLDHYARLGAGGSTGLLVDLLSFWRLQAEAGYRYHFLGDTRAGPQNVRFLAGANFRPGRNVELRAVGRRWGVSGGNEDVVGLLGVYF